MDRQSDTESSGSGIVYTLTVKDAETVAAWLQSRGIPAMPYHGEMESEEREDLEERLLYNEVKVLVATIALGMGFDKPDVGFVIHFQRPPSVVHYYQQVGRAGRAIPEAYGVLLSGAEDDEIADYFVRTAFPAEEEVGQVLTALRGATAGLRRSDLQQKLNLTASTLDKVLKFLLLESPSPIQRVDQRYMRNPVPWQMPIERIDRIRNLRRQEQERIREYISTDRCLMQFLSAELNDPAAIPCGQCSNCQRTGLPVEFPQELSEAATAFLNELDLPIVPRKQWPAGHGFEGDRGSIALQFRTELGHALCRWGDPGFGELVKAGKQQTGSFSDELVAAAAWLIRQRWIPRPSPTWVTCVPSRRHSNLVPDMARRLSAELGLAFVNCIHTAKETEPQKTRQNSVQQVSNLEGTFELDRNRVRAGPVLLIDDMVDSRWTFTVLGFKLRRAGSGAVFPFALADTSVKGGD